MNSAAVAKVIFLRGYKGVFKHVVKNTHRMNQIQHMMRMLDRIRWHFSGYHHIKLTQIQGPCSCKVFENGARVCLIGFNKDQLGFCAQSNKALQQAFVKTLCATLVFLGGACC